ncbi:hypothetical protein ACFE04_010331 [Oxalis oulophora]
MLHSQKEVRQRRWGKGGATGQWGRVVGQRTQLGRGSDWAEESATARAWVGNGQGTERLFVTGQGNVGRGWVGNETNGQKAKDDAARLVVVGDSGWASKKNKFFLNRTMVGLKTTV